MLTIVGGVTATQPAVRVSVPPPVIETAIVPAGLHCPQWYEPAETAGWADDEIAQLDRIIWRESSCEQGATHVNANGTIDRGLMQINDINLGWLADVGVSADDLLLGGRNLQAARLLYEQHGWSPWRPLP